MKLVRNIFDSLIFGYGSVLLARILEKLYELFTWNSIALGDSDAWILWLFQILICVCFFLSFVSSRIRNYLGIFTLILLSGIWVFFFGFSYLHLPILIALISLCLWWAAFVHPQEDASKTQNKRLFAELVISTLILSFVFAPLIGQVYSSFFPIGGGWIGTDEFWETFTGFFIGLIFFSVLLFELFGNSNQKKSHKWRATVLILLALLLIFSGLYFSVLLALVAYGLGWAGRKWLLKR